MSEKNTLAVVGDLVDQLLLGAPNIGEQCGQISRNDTVSAAGRAFGISHGRSI